jgi:23S rRNA (uracil1939-C5)-methyltransferase
MGYRNRIRVFSNAVNHYGLMRRGTHEVVPFDACAIMPEQFNTDILPWLRMLPPAEQIVVRMDGQGGWLVSIFGPSQRLKMMRKVLGALPEGEPPAPGCVGLLYNNLPLWGRGHLVHEVAGHKYRVSAKSFFQGNHAETEAALAVIREWIGELKEAETLGPLLGDLFCGVGLFSLALADLFEKVIAVDSDEGGCRDAKNNVKHSEAARDKVSVHVGRLDKVLVRPDLAPPAIWNSSLCLVDPPRAGLGKEGVKTLLDLGPRHLMYMSCDPATLARDAAAFVAEGYEVKKLRVLDMFPQTSHIESLLLLEKSGD